jgi:RimJ/RimL family protein N-acetyltransferase
MPRSYISHYAKALRQPLTPLPSLGVAQRVIRSERLLLRTLRPEHVYDLYESGADPRFTELSHGLLRSFKHLEEAQRQLDNTLSVAAAGYCLPYAILLAKDERYIGHITLTVEPGTTHKHRMQVEYGVDPRWWGHGFGVEALTALIADTFADLKLGVIKIEGFCTVENLPSIRTMEAAGMRRVAVLEQHHQHEGRLHDISLHAVLKRDQPQVSGGPPSPA